MAESKNDIDPELTEDAGTGPGCLGTTVKSGLVVLVVIVALLFIFCLEKVEAYEIGLRFWNFWAPPIAKRGDVDMLRPGWNIIIPKLHEFNTYDCRIQRFEMAPSYRDMPAPDMGSLKIRTARDQDEIYVYVTILFKVKRGMAMQLREQFPTNEDIRKQGIQVVCPQRLQDRLGEIMTANQFYSMTKKKSQQIIERRKTQPDYLRDKYPTDEDLLDRTTQVDKAMDDMNSELEPYGVKVVNVLIWDFKFKDEIEASIISKVVADEKVEMEAALKEAALSRGEWQKLVAEANAAAEAELARGTAETRKIQAQADKYLVEKIARGDRLILQAQAEGQGKINRALAGKGGRVYVGLEYAKALEGIDLIILPAGGEDGVNPLNLDKTLKQIQLAAPRGTAP